MKVTRKYFLCMFAVLALAGTGCSRGNDVGSTAAEASHKEKAGGFTIPVDGTPGERVRKLWEATGPVMKADARTNLSDGEYQKKRTALFSAWVMLQGKLSLAEPKDEKAQRLIPEVLKFIDNLYGFPGFPQEKREKDRETAKKFFDRRFGKLDTEIKGLK